MPDRTRGRVLAAAAALAGVPLLGGGHTTLAVWTDSATVQGTAISTVAVTAPQVSCGRVRPQGVTVSWQPVPDATGYRVYLGPVLLEERPAGATDATLAVAGTVTVRAAFGPWESPDSAPLALTLVPPSCS